MEDKAKHADRDPRFACGITGCENQSNPRNRVILITTTSDSIVVYVCDMHFKAMITPQRADGDEESERMS